MINNEKLHLITDLDGYTPEISRLLSMMNYARFTTLHAVKELSTEELDCVVDPEGNSIGALLLHFAAVEYYYQVDTFEERELNENELSKWGPALDLGEEGRKHIKGNDLSYYLNILDEVRNQTFDLFKSVDDEWLHKEAPFWYDKPANNYFKWFHVFEDEINHRGQIRLIRKKLQPITNK